MYINLRQRDSCDLRDVPEGQLYPLHTVQGQPFCHLYSQNQAYLGLSLYLGTSLQNPCHQPIYVVEALQNHQDYFKVLRN